MGNVCTKQTSVVIRDKTENDSKQIENATDLKSDQSPDSKINSDIMVEQDVKREESDSLIKQSSSLWKFSSTEVMPDINPALRDSLTLTHYKQSTNEQYTNQFADIEEEIKIEEKSVKFQIP